MKNVQIAVKHGAIVKSSGVYLIIFALAVSLCAYKSNTSDDDASSDALKSVPANWHLPAFFPIRNINEPAPHAAKLNSRVVAYTRKYILAEGERLEKMKVWGKVYFEIYDRILSDYGLPKELKYLSVIESDLTSKAVSASGAVGPWQIMSEEATRMGLKINRRVDERKNFRKSTEAAAKILKELYSQFHDWTLVIAAYNCGAGRVRQAMRKSGSKNFWYLQEYLPIETRYHVKRFMGTHYFFEGSGGVTTMTAPEMKRYQAKIARHQIKPLRDENNYFTRFLL